jgi:hypothetical protein
MTARTGMSQLIEDLRGLTDANPQEWTLGTTVYWADDTLQRVLDNHRTDLQRILCKPWPVYLAGGVINWLTYQIGYNNLEGGTVFTLEDATGADIGTAAYTMDYTRGVITFGTDTLGSSMFVTAHSYDMWGAAAEVWRKKGANAAKMYNFSTDGHNLQRSQYWEHCNKQAAYFEAKAEPTIMEVYREDMLGIGDAANDAH